MPRPSEMYRDSPGFGSSREECLGSDGSELVLVRHFTEGMFFSRCLGFRRWIGTRSGSGSAAHWGYVRQAMERNSLCFDTLLKVCSATDVQTFSDAARSGSAAYWRRVGQPMDRNSFWFGTLVNKDSTRSSCRTMSWSSCEQQSEVPVKQRAEAPIE